MKKDAKCKEGNPFIAIPSVLGGIFLVIVLFFLIFAPSQLSMLSTIVWGFVVLGFFAMLFAWKAMQKK